MRRHPEALVVAGVLVSLGLLALAIARLDVHGFVATLRSAVLWPWLPLAITSYLAGHVVRGMRCRRLISREASLGLTTATNVVVLGYAINNLLPARLGELARAGMLAERTGLSYAQTLTLTVLERILDGLVLLLLLAVTLGVMPVHGWMAATLEFAGLVFGCASVVVLLAVLMPGALLALVSRATSRFGHVWHDRAVGLASAVSHGVAYLRRPGDAVRVALLSLVVWLCEAGMFLFLLPAMGLRASPATALMTMAVTNLGILVPSTPGYIGVFHFLCMQALMTTGVGREVALGYASLVHLSFYVPITLWGLGVMFSYGLSLGRATALSRAAERDAGPFVPAGTLMPSGAEIPYSLGHGLGRQPPPTPFMRALIEALIPLDRDGIQGAARERVLEQIAQFVQVQTEALPRRLGTLLAAGLAGFRLVTVLTHGRSFRRLPLERRRRWTESWAYGSVGPARQLFRAPRSLALLAYYETDVVRSARALETSRGAITTGTGAVDASP